MTPTTALYIGSGITSALGLLFAGLIWHAIRTSRKEKK